MNIFKKINSKLESDLGSGGAFIFKKIIIIFALFNALMIFGSYYFGW